MEQSVKDLVSIIIPVYNAQDYIEDTLKTIQAQTYPYWEIVLVDDCSRDKSVSVIQKYVNSQIKLYQLEKNSGPAIARNLGLEKAKGRFIAYMDADDLWHPKKLEEQINFMQKNNGAFSYTGYRYANAKGKPHKRTIHIPEKLTYQKALKNTRILTISTMFDLTKIERNLLKMPNIASEDVATWWNILKQGYIAYGLNKDLVYYRRIKTSLTANKLMWWKKRWNLYRKTEKLSFFKSLYYFFFYVIYGIEKRIG